MVYNCEKCKEPCKCVRWYDKLKMWICDKCYFMFG